MASGDSRRRHADGQGVAIVDLRFRAVRSEKGKFLLVVEAVFNDEGDLLVVASSGAVLRPSFGSVL